ncbi:alpha/beta fold hydrolase [Nonomuraea sp. NPDC052634]|uniref:alpha/beta fold hydrolase n=1 Tax=Nonomuraea sp. NPDC052634 TaxID=3155813 RepID=UPI00342B10C9
MALVARITGRVVAGAGVLALSPVLGLAALAGTAMVGARPVVFAVTGLAVFASVFFLGLLLCVPRPRAVWGRWVRAVALLAVEALVVWQVGAATLGPPPPAEPVAKVPGQREWRLPTGSRLAYVRTAPKRVTRPEPVVFLHGGPGIGDLAGDAAFYGRLASEGFEVYVYDQVGAGRSARLADPRGYGLDRDVADLEAIRRLLRAERLNLVARDHGAQLAAAYLVRHPGRVARAALYSPDGLTPSRPAAPALPNPANLASDLPDPRTLAIAALLRVDPPAAHAYAGEAGLAAYLARLRRTVEPPCPSPPGTTSDRGEGAGGPAGTRAPEKKRTDKEPRAPAETRVSGAMSTASEGNSSAPAGKPAARGGEPAARGGETAPRGEETAPRGEETAPRGGAAVTRGRSGTPQEETGASREKSALAGDPPGGTGDPPGGYVAVTGRPGPASLRADLAEVEVPVLIVKSACDAESWSAAAAYQKTLPDARLAYLGDVAEGDRSTAHLRLLRAFLTGRPVPAYEGDTPPPGYRGPV